MRLVNLNIGIKIDNAEKVSNYIKATNPDFVTLQEVCRPLEDKVLHTFRSLETLDEFLGNKYPYKFFGPLWVTDAIREGKKVVIDFGGHIEQGNEVLSKFPIIKATNEHLHKTYSYALDWANWREEDHGRALQVVKVEVNGKPLQILNIHGIWTKDKKGDERTIKECEYIVKAAKRENIPTIIAGDINLLPETKSIKILRDQFRDLITEFDIKTTRPDFKDEIDEGINAVDYIFVNKGIEVQEFQVEKSDISDHYPLILDFEIT